MEYGWASTCRLMTSAAYRQSARRPSEESIGRPDADLKTKLWRMNLRRVEPGPPRRGLAVSDRLDRTTCGPPSNEMNPDSLVTVS